MDIRLRPITPEEFPAFQRAASRAFGEHASAEEFEAERGIFDFEGSIAAFAGDRIVGTGVLFPFTLTVPGNREVRAGGVSWITVQPDFRRRGILTSMVRRQFADARERGEPLAILYASESIIYGRYGYGVASSVARFSIDTRHGRFERPPSGDGRVRLIEKDEAARIFPEIYERTRRTQPGAIAMLPGWWEYYFSDPERWWKDASPRYYVICEDTQGGPEGYAAYRMQSTWEGGFPRGTLKLVSLDSETREARCALWRYLLDVDLIATVETMDLPIDEPLRLMLADPRRLRTARFSDALWLRLLDIPAALVARRYRVVGEIVMEVVDPFLPENCRRYALAGGPDGVECHPTDAPPHLKLEVRDLGAAYLGGTRLSTLAEAGRVQELQPGALARADLMFSGERTPYTAQQF